MSGFIGKIKQGAAEAGKRAQQTIEVNRLKLQIAAKQKDMQKLYTQIGEIVYEAYKHEDPYPDSQVAAVTGDLSTLDAEIKAMRDRMYSLYDEKSCECGHVVAIDTRFCPNCGRKFEPYTEPAQFNAIVDLKPFCPHCKEDIEPGMQYCTGCGYHLSEEDIAKQEQEGGVPYAGKYEEAFADSPVNQEDRDQGNSGRSNQYVQRDDNHAEDAREETDNRYYGNSYGGSYENKPDNK
ncbi:zinc ribbon domain-containing protein [Paenibacillus lutrae]|uniref:DZANK-type domain-containing protein n=1 Tax=Paenibacillus lutrae TaxID=2078573 RepID=A0A7X3FHI8_9BACL|nr:zinc ribbon domain-containing protein [Paenibacillus lutrae]MVO99893.1 hypothetical protein [Paenibacillus lutrae]